MSSEGGGQPPKVHTTGKEGEEENIKTFLHYVRSGQFDIDFALGLKTQWNIPDTVLNSPEARIAAVEGVTRNLELGNGDEAVKIKTIFTLLTESLQTPEIEAAKRKGFVKALNSGRVKQAKTIADEFLLPDDEKEKMLIDAIEQTFLGGDSAKSDNIAETFNVPPEKMTEKTREMALEEFQSYIRSSQPLDRDIALDIKRTYGLSDEVAPVGKS